MTNQLKKLCTYCGNSYTKLNRFSVKYFLEKSKFCSRECYIKSMKGFTPFAGKKHSQETKDLLREKRKLQETTPAMLSGLEIGRHKVWTEEMKNKLRDSALNSNLGKRTAGDKHWNWKGGIYPETQRLRASEEYKIWRKTVFENGNYTCTDCKIRGGKLVAHHIKYWSTHPELRFEVSNGRILCRTCHSKFHRQERTIDDSGRFRN